MSARMTLERAEEMVANQVPLRPWVESRIED